MKRIQAAMHENLMIAMDAFRKLPGKKMQAAEMRIREIIFLKYQMEAITDQKGYSQACRNFIPICKGECCKWHFPGNLTHLDFFTAIFDMSEAEQATMAELILNNHKHQCPVLLETGCFLSFERRPVICTNAYPCFHDQSYWNAKERQNILFKKAFDSLEVIVPFQNDRTVE